MHPSIELIEACVLSIRKQLPHIEIRILCDGVRPAMEHRREQYAEYVRRLAPKALQWGGICLSVFKDHRQQAGMLKTIVDYVRTPLLMFVEHDATIDDKPIDWKGITDLLLSEKANTVRLYWNQDIHEEHTHLMLEREGDYVKTIQWSSWPYVSRVDFHRRILQEHFADDDKKMTETVLYSPCLRFPWDAFKTWIYCPPGDGVRFHHADGRTDRTTGLRDPGEW